MNTRRLRQTLCGVRAWCRRSIGPAGAILALLWLGCAASAVRAGTLSEITNRQAFAICADPDALPFSSRAGNPPGLQIDLARLVAVRLRVGLDIDWVFARRAARRAGCDAFMSAIDEPGIATHGEPRQRRLRQALTQPYAQLVTRVVTRAGAPAIRSFDDLRKTVVAVPPGSYLHYLLYQHDVRVRTLWRSDLDILAAVAHGQVPAGIVSNWNFGWYRKTHPDARLALQSGFVLEPDLDYNVVITLRDTDQNLVLAVNRILGGLMAKGRVAAIFAKYGISYRPPTAQ